MLFVANVDEGDDEVPDGRGRRTPQRAGAARGGGLLAARGRAGRARRRGGGGDARGARRRASPASQRVVRGAFSLLDLIAFFTAGEDKPAQSWHLRRGLPAWHAAGEIHSDIQRGFVRAEVIGWDELVDAGGYARRPRSRHAAPRGPRLRDADGDVITVKFTP